MGSSTVAWVPGVALVMGCIASLAGACGGNAFTSGTSDAGGEGSTLDGPGAEAAADSPPGDEGDSSEPPAGKVVYVSTSGDDGNTGLDRTRPKKTIASALTEAASRGAGAEVHICGGTYAETGLTLKSAVGLRGGWDCASWMRSPGYGFPVFDGKNQTIVTNGAATTQHTTLVVTGTGVTPGTAIDGLTVEGSPSAAAGATYGIDVEGAASPVITNVIVTGGGGAAGSSTYGSVGIRIGGTSSAELVSSVIAGGSGTGPIGSVGVALESTGTPSVHDDVVTGGTGTVGGASPGMGAVGVYVAASLDPSRPLSTLIVSGSDKGGATGSSVGVLVSGTGVDAGIAGCEVQGGTGTGAGAASIGVDVGTTGTVSMTADRVYGGARAGGTVQTYGVLVASAASFTLQSSEVHAGTVPATAGSYAVGVALTSTSAPLLAFDTIYTGGASGIDVLLTNNVTGVRLTDDLMLGSYSGMGTYGVQALSCSNMIGTFDHSAFVNLTTLYTCGTPPSSALDPGSLMGILGPKADGDLEVESMTLCGTAAWCVPDTSCPSVSVAPCMTSLLGSSWSATDDGVASLFLAPAADGGTTTGGWQFQPTTRCALARGGTPVTGITTDMFGATRSATVPTIGAVEYHAMLACTP